MQDSEIDVKIVQAKDFKWFCLKKAVKNVCDLYVDVLLPFLNEIQQSEKILKLKSDILNAKFMFLLFWTFDMHEDLGKVCDKFQSNNHIGLSIPETLDDAQLKVECCLRCNCVFAQFRNSNVTNVATKTYRARSKVH